MPSRAVIALLAVLIVAPARASAGIPVAVYPFKVPGLSGQRRTDFNAVLQAALAGAARRGVLAPRQPLFLAATCGDAPTPPCLAQAARDGVVLSGRGEVRSGVVLVTAALWDARGQTTREVRFPVDLVIENLRPIASALMELEVEIEPDGTVARPDAGPVARDPRGAKPSLSAIPLPPPPVPKAAPARAPEAPAERGAPAPGRSAAAQPGPAAKPAPAPRPLAVEAPAPAPSGWRRAAGPWVMGGGLALVAGGATVALLNKRRADDLDARYARGTLTPADRSGYDRVERDNVLSTVLLSAGGAAFAGGAWLWVSAPSAGQPAVAAVGGRF